MNPGTVFSWMVVGNETIVFDGASSVLSPFAFSLDLMSRCALCPLLDAPSSMCLPHLAVAALFSVVRQVVLTQVRREYVS